MAIAIDTSVLLDVVLPDPAYSEAAISALLAARRNDDLIVCETVISELCPAATFPILELLYDWEIHFVPSSLESAILAGKMYAEYLRRGGKRGRVVADFLIGAHAELNGGKLLARDRGYFRDYFRNLNVILPSDFPKPNGPASQ